jgi:DNA-binding CsgD family transcriptional regulator
VSTAPKSHPTSRSILVAEQQRSFAPSRLTQRQLECLGWVQEGKSASDIGGILGISGRTVEGHLLKVCDHFGVRTRFQAVLKARDLGLITSSEVRDAGNC